mmetsp:Transcript_42666/g.112456  ORF Transcript_42666/g.112456 Transcript_42666/m.112456 type:complete len:203 (+) Transcript_42666:564-1172(+)
MLGRHLGHDEIHRGHTSDERLCERSNHHPEDGGSEHRGLVPVSQPGNHVVNHLARLVLRGQHPRHQHHHPEQQTRHTQRPLLLHRRLQVLHRSRLVNAKIHRGHHPGHVPERKNEQPQHQAGVADELPDDDHQHPLQRAVDPGQHDQEHPREPGQGEDELEPPGCVHDGGHGAEDHGQQGPRGGECVAHGHQERGTFSHCSG